MSYETTPLSQPNPLNGPAVQQRGQFAFCRLYPPHASHRGRVWLLLRLLDLSGNQLISALAAFVFVLGENKACHLPTLN
jgi:hypothetical protein